MEKAGDGDFLRTVAEAVLQLLMEADVEGLIGAGRYERSRLQPLVRVGDHQRSGRVHWMRNALSYVAKTWQSMVAAALRQAFIQPDRAQASQTLRHVTDQLRPKWPKLAAFVDDSEIDVLSHLDFPEQHRTKLHSTNSLERLNKEVKRRADVVRHLSQRGIDHPIDRRGVARAERRMAAAAPLQVEAMAELAAPANEAETKQIGRAA